MVMFLDVVEVFVKFFELEKVGEVCSKVYEFCKEQYVLGELVEIEVLFGYLDENELQKFKEFVFQVIELLESGVLYLDYCKVKKLVCIVGLGGGMSVFFFFDFVNQVVYYDCDKDVLIIICLFKVLWE